MDDDEFCSNVESVNGESEDELTINSEEDNNSDSLNDGEDPKSSYDDIDPAVLVNAFKHLRGVAALQQAGQVKDFVAWPFLI